MTEARFDYLRFTIKPEHELPNESDESGKTPYDHCMSTLKCTLLLGDLFSKMVDCGRCLHYDRRWSYENVNLKVPTPDRYSEQGICLEFSSHGLDYFNSYLDSYGVSFKTWCGMLRALCFRGYAISITRLDYAMDDICRNGDNTTISLRRVVNAIQDGNLCCKARVWSDQGDDFRKLFSYKASKKRRNGEELEGLTVQFGARQSEQICRFYDKFTEQKMKGNELPEGCTAWTRCEFEYKGGNAMSVFNAYIDYSDKEFAEYMTGSALNFVRFVNRTSDNVSRCEVKRWWKSFLNGATKAVKFNKVKAAKSAFMRFSRGFKKQYLRKLWTVIDVWGWDGLQDWIERSVDEELNKGVVYIDKELQHNLEDGQRYYESFDGFRRFSSCSALSAEELEKNIREQHFDYFKQFYSIVRLGKRPDPAGVV